MAQLACVAGGIAPYVDSRTLRELEALRAELDLKPGTTARDLSPLDRRRRIPVRLAAALHRVHETTFKKHYAHLIKKFGPRLNLVELGDALDLPPPPPP